MVVLDDTKESLQNQDVSKKSSTADDNRNEGAPPNATDNRNEGAPPNATDNRNEGAPPAATDNRNEGAPPAAADNRNEGAPLAAADNRNEGAPLAAADNRNEGAPPAAADNRNEGAPPAAADNRNEGAPPAAAGNPRNRIDDAVHLFTMLYGKISEHHFSYLIKFKNGTSTFSFDVSQKAQLEAMARTAFNVSNNGFDIWHSVNPVNVKPSKGKRGNEHSVSYQTAVVADIDIRSSAHKGKQEQLAADFDEAKSFLPFTPSLIINSGYGLHAYYIFDTPIKITNENREDLKRRNNLLLDVIRKKANGKKIDGVGDLPRILRTPGTFNYKLGRKNAPLCHIVEDSGLRFSPAELDEKLNALIAPAADSVITPAPAMTPTPVRQQPNDYVDDDPELKEFRIRHMLDHINVVDGEYEKWIGVGFALFNENMDCGLWEQWSRSQPDFKEGECERKWNGFHHEPNGLSIASLYQWAVEGGYNETDTLREYYQLHPNLSKKTHMAASLVDTLQAKLHSNDNDSDSFEHEKNRAIKLLKSVKAFDNDTLFSDEIIKAAAFAKLFDQKTFSDFKSSISLNNRQNKGKKVSVHDWTACVREAVEALKKRKNDLMIRRNNLVSQLQTASFIAQNDTMQNMALPDGYYISKNGVEKVVGKSVTLVCRRPVIIKSKIFSVEEKIYKLELAYQKSNGKWKTLPPVEAATVFNKTKLINLANYGFPVTSSNSSALVDYLDALNAENENNFTLNYIVPRCGWYKFDNRDCFIDPRRVCRINEDDNNNVYVNVDSNSIFANSLRTNGNLNTWKKVYDLAKQSPIARLMSAAAVAPILLKILGERNFLLYICAPTRAGKTTALNLCASVIGDEKMIRSFDATKNGLAGAAADVADFAFLVDEKQVADSNLKEQFDNLVYALANGIGRTKLNKDSSLRKVHDWRTVAIMTGETRMLRDNVTGGANTRLLSISTTKEILSPSTCNLIHNTIKEHYGLAFPLVIDKVFQLGFDKLRKEYKKIVDLFSTNYSECLGEYRRYMAVLTLADALLNAGLHDADTLVIEDTLPVDDAIENATKVFPLIPTYEEIAETEHEKDFVLATISQNQNRFISANKPAESIPVICGKLRDSDGYTYITAKFLQEECDRHGFDYQKIVSDLIGTKFFISAAKYEKGRMKIRSAVNKKIGSISTRCYRIRNSSLNPFELDFEPKKRPAKK